MERQIYVASSWKNTFQQTVVKFLRDQGHKVYDFRNPGEGKTGFDWQMIDPDYKNWTLAQYREALKHPSAVAGFENDKEGMDWADTCVLVLPCGASAHTEAGQMSGEGKDVFVLGDASVPLSSYANPELMYNLFTNIVGSLNELAKFESMHESSWF